jgi:hypothetical protein
VHQRFRVAEPFQRLVVADVGHHEPVAHVAGTVIEENALLDLVDTRVEVPTRREL